MDVIAAAFRALPDRRLVMAGDGPEADRVRAAAGPNVEFAGSVTRERMRDLLRGARAFLFAAEEDFGILPVEAQACGTPVIAYGRGGALETVRDRAAGRPTGQFFLEQTRGRPRCGGAPLRDGVPADRSARLRDQRRALLDAAVPRRVHGIRRRRMARIRARRVIIGPPWSEAY